MQTIQLHPNDNVAIAHTALSCGTLMLEHRSQELLDDIPTMHKVAIRNIAKGETIRKFNQIIGYAAVAIRAGQHVHDHNCQVSLVQQRSATAPTDSPKPLAVEAEQTFMGYLRDNGEVGTRNYLGIITTVNCSATVAHKIASHCNNLPAFRQQPNFDGMVALSHRTGCGMSTASEGYRILQRTIEGYAAHPNFGGIILVGLGCEVMAINKLLEASSFPHGNRVQTLIIQQSGGTAAAVEQGIQLAETMLPTLLQAQRTPQGASKLKLALQCGGSDALSGITVNPAIGSAADILVAQGGTAILSETPEMYGAEHLLLQRAVTPQVREKFEALITWWEEYARQHNASLDNNPSPGNKQGGLTTILEKSLGAQAKGGGSPLNGVYQYAERVDTSGLVFMDSPGFDPVSVTGQVASGANIVCFTTGRGSAFGFKPVPVIKLSSNSAIYEHMSDDIDFNCGGILQGQHSVQECGREIFNYLLKVASGEQTSSERLGYGDHEFSPWQIGAVL